MSNDKVDGGKTGFSIYLSNPWYLFKTVYLILTWIVLGVHLEMIGPTLDILAKQVNVNYDGISYALVTRSVGYILPNVFSVLLQTVVQNHPELLLCLSYFVACAVMFLTPLMKTLFWVCALFLFQGISQGVTDLAGTNLVLSMWSVHSGAPLNLVHLGYGFGAVLSNLLALSLIKSGNESSGNSLVSSYWIGSTICLLLSLGHLIIWIRQKKINNQTKKNDVELRPANNDDQPKKDKESSEAEETVKPKMFIVSMTIIWSIYMFFLSGNDQTFGKFFFVYLKSKFDVDRPTGTLAMTIYWFSYSLGRLIFALLSVFISATAGLNIIWILGVIVIGLWLIFLKVVQMTIVHLFILGAFTGLTFSPTFPLSFAYISQHLKVTPFLVGIFLCGGSTGAITFQKLSGYLLDEEPGNFPYLMIFCVSGSILFYVLSMINSRVHQRSANANEKKTNSGLPKDDLQQVTTELVDNKV